ncbi:MAG: hypothetical protein GF364_15510, partial [Candidatus Lokiarchaeota archaeon]|nr:hypothetical protein [Candidatus Lokiarchaeota archaeon]
MSFNEQLYREKVWEILNLIQANQLYVHSAVIEIPINVMDDDELDDSIVG